MQFESYFLFWLIVVLLPLALAPIFIVFLEKKKRRETLQQVYSWLKEKSKKLYVDNVRADNPRIVAELNPEWQLDRVEITTFPIGAFTSPGRGTFFFLPRSYLNISGIKKVKSPMRLAIGGRDPMSATINWSEFKQNFKTDDPTFDRRFSVKGEGSDVIPRILSDDEFRKHILGIYDLIKFEVKGNGHVSFVVECYPDVKSFENSILAMKRIIEILSESS